ncbi:MAG: thioredoxin family protein [Sphingorhabdus sp.]
MMLIRLFLAFTLLFAGLVPANAQMPGAPLNIDASIAAETQTPAPGQSVTLAIVMKPNPGWHDYWLNPGDAGTPPVLEWDLPAGVTAGEIRAPVPGTLIVSGFMNHIYERDHAFLVDLIIADSALLGTKLPIRVEALWSACTDRVCVPEATDLSLDLAVGDGNIAAGQRAIFDGYRAQIPALLSRDGIFTVDGQQVRYAIPYPANADLESAYIFLKTPNFARYTAEQSVERRGDWLIITSEVKPEDQVYEGQIKPSEFTEVEALLAIGENDGLLVRLKRGDTPASGMNFGGILLFSILGGLLLNLMPCVFPILGLKAASLAKMGGNEAAAKRDALAYSAGVILSVLALGAVMLALRAAGEQVGWAFQLQEPRIILLLLLLMAAITANLAGLFEINVGMPAGSGKSRFGSFGTGVLAAVIATPCTGPFMAAALGAALLLPAAQALLLFAGLGIGIALPYLAIAYIPALRNRVPKAGPWLATFRKIMAIPMALTAVALLWLLWRLSGQQGLLIGVGALAALLGALFLAGNAQRRGKTAMLMAMSALGIAVASAVILPRQPVAAHRNSDDILAAEEYSDARLAGYRAAGRRVFVYFTADWCITCKINEGAAINRDETAAAFKAKNVAVLVGDFTRRDPEIARILARYGRSGVPLYLYFAPGKDAQILPQILTPSALTGLK